MNRFIRIPIVVASLMVGPLVTSVAFADPPPAANPQTPHAHQARQHRGGGLLEESLRTIQLRPDQRQAVEQIQSLLKPGRDAAKAARKDFAEALAAQVRAGTIDVAALTPKSNVVVLAAVNERAQERASIDGLHRVLDRAQRTQLADALEARMNQPHAANAANAQGQQHAHRGHGEGHRLARELGLSDAQKAQIRAIFEEDAKSRPHRSAQAAKEEHKKVLDAFKADAFAMDQVAPNNAAQMSREHLQRFVGMVQKIMPVLTAQQRSVAADKMIAHAQHGKLEL